MNDHARLRKKLCLEIAEDILEVIGTSPVDPDEIARVIETRLPSTYDEAEADYQEQIKRDDEPSPTDWREKPDSLMGRMCAALGLDRKEHTLKVILEAAIERIQKGIDVNAAKAEMIRMRKYVMIRSIPIGDCVAWNKLKKVFGMGNREQDDRDWLEAYESKEKGV